MVAYVPPAVNDNGNHNSNGNNTMEGPTATTSTTSTTNSNNPSGEPVASLDSERASSRSRRNAKKSSGASSSKIRHRSGSKTATGSRSSSNRRSKSSEKESSTNGSTPALATECLTKDRRPNPQIPPQLGNINPLASNDTGSGNDKLEDSLRLSSLGLNSSISTAPTSDSTSTSNQNSFLLLPAKPTSDSNIPNPTASPLIIAPPDAVTSQLLQAIQEHQQNNAGTASNNAELADLLQQAMGKLVQTATENGNLVVSPATTTPTVTQLQQEMHKQHQVFQEFQKQMLKQQHQQQTQIQQQAQLLQQQQTLVEAQQKQLLDLKNEVLQNQQSVRSQRTSPSPTRSPLKTRKQPKKSIEEEENNTMDRLENSELFEAAQQQLEASEEDDTGDAAKKKVVSNEEDSHASIETEYEDDSDYPLDEKEREEKELELQAKAKAKSQQSSPPPADGLVDVWICPKCNFEHEFSRLQFCGVCGTAKPDKAASTIADANTVTATGSESFSNLTAPSSRPSSRSALLLPAQEKLNPLQVHKEPRGGTSSGDTERDLPSKSPGRRRAQYKKSKSTTELHGRGPVTPRRMRPRLPPRSKTQNSQSSLPLGTASFHGGSAAARKESMVVKCLDKGAVFDIDVLNQQLHTFERSSQVLAGSAPTSSAPKTPKVNKRNAFRRTKSQLDEPEDEPSSPVAPPGVFTAKVSSSVRQVIPRRTKSNSSAQLRMHQMQQNGGMLVPPSPSLNKRGLLGAAVSALHKSPKKAISALKIAGSAVPKSLMLGGNSGGGSGAGSGKDKGKNHAFLLDSDNESGDEGNTTTTKNGHSPSADANDPTSLEPPFTPRRRGSLEARAKASAIMTGTGTGSNQKTSGWKKWFESGSKNTAAIPLTDNHDDESPELDIDDSVHDVDDEDLFETDESDEEPSNTANTSMAAGNPRQRNRRNKSHRGSSGRRRSVEVKESDTLGGRSSTHGNNRNQNRGTEEIRSSRHDMATPRQRDKARPRRTKSMENPNRNRSENDALDRQGSGHRLHTSSGQLLMAAPTTPGKNRRRRNTLDRRSGPRDFSDPPPDSGADNGTKKTDQLKQRVEGLKKNSMDQNTASGKLNAQQRKATPSHSEDVSESTDGCTIYLDEMSVGGMSEITHNVF